MLEEDSLIYSKEDRKPERAQIRSMPLKKRVQYFFQYYALYVLAAVIIISVAALLLYHYLKPPEVVSLYAAVYNQAWSEEGKAELEKLLRERAGIDEDANVYIDDSFFDGQQGLDKLQVYLANKQVDLVVASKEDFKTLAGYGFFKDLEQVADIPAACREKLIGARGYLDTDEISLDDHETGQGEELFYGMELEKNPWNQAEGQRGQGVVVSIAAEAPNEGNAVSFMEILAEGK